MKSTLGCTEIASVHLKIFLRLRSYQKGNTILIEGVLVLPKRYHT